MMTDTIINNLPAEGLRVVMRSLLAAHPEVTHSFEAETQKYIEETALPTLEARQPDPSLIGLKRIQQIIRCMLGCGLCYRALPVARDLVNHALVLLTSKDAGLDSDVSDFLASVDGDIVQSVTAIQKTLFVSSGMRELSVHEKVLVEELHQSLMDCCKQAVERGLDCPYGRALSATSSLLGLSQLEDTELHSTLAAMYVKQPVQTSDTFEMGGKRLPRIFSGLWQLSSPAWGSASAPKIFAQFAKHVESGFSAFDMADHYGDAEIIFGRFRSAFPHGNSIFAATKYCVFHPMTVTKDAVRANVTERCQRLGSDKVDLLQFHWQFYADPQYLDALRYLAEDERVSALGLCNFDTEHLEAALSNGIRFSLIDSRPMIRMGEVCDRHNVKLLTYGTLCGGFLADKWLGKPEPDLYNESITPSQRKYHGMIRSWGTWALFQELLTVLQNIGMKHKASISNVATRWVLDFPYVGAVIVGVRMGISEHTKENLASLGWRLDENDQTSIDAVLRRSRRLEMFDAMGDCGGEYR
ncbi:uncharacterized protein JN550_002469 [Neoarthrinium moseri]|uniref:uncharacterized protein n=1 Tax=Neoarthrinium moseri TaxID=1658444 RepID=UPI001FDE5EF6|nr:uncharacterized protein JN550_002469 [Neoarthrinium moseri]KAI1875040.1 hypothetical protein JN550_002469 [Neoarthrinium moseri]